MRWLNNYSQEAYYNMQKTTTQINIDLLMRALIKQNDLRFSYAVRAFLLYVKEPVFVQNKEAFF